MSCPRCGHDLDLHDEDQERCARGCTTCRYAAARRRAEAEDLAAVRELRRTIRCCITDPADLLRQVYGEPVVSWSSELQPVPLHRARVVLRGRVKVMAHLEDRDRDYRQELRLRWLASRLGRRPIEGELAAALTFRGRANRYTRNAPDLSNLVKAIEDAGNPDREGGWRGLWRDDAQIKVLFARLQEWAPDARPLVRLELWRIGG